MKSFSVFLSYNTCKFADPQVVYGSTVSAPCCLVVLFHSKCFYLILS